MGNIDIIIYWVTSDDESWKHNFNKFCLVDGVEDTVSVAPHYKDWGTLKFIFRMIDTHMSWVNRIIFVSNGQRPGFDFSDKVTFVTHDEFMDPKGLPTFNSSAIETQFHKISELSSHFIIWNDDFYLFSDVSEEQFRSKDKRLVDTLKLRFKVPAIVGRFRKTSLSNIEMVRRSQDLAVGALKSRLSRLIWNLVFIFLEVRTWHFPQVHCKKNWLTLSEIYQAEFSDVAISRFRSSNFNQYLMRNYILLNFGTQKRDKSILKNSYSFFISNSKDIKRLIENVNSGCFFVNLSECGDISDSEWLESSSVWKDFLETRYSVKSKYEL